MPISELSSKNKVLSHDNEFNSVTRFYNPEYFGDLVVIKNQLGEVSLTSDHLVYAMQIPKNSTFAHHDYKKKIPVSWVHAGDLEKGDICLYPIPKKIENIEFINIPIKAKYDFKSKEIPTKIKISGDLLRLFGYFLAEGWTREKRAEVQFCFGIKEMHLAKDVERIIKTIFNLDSKIKTTEKDHKIVVSIYNIHLSNYFGGLFGRRAHNKKIPDSFIFLSTDLQAELIYGLWKGDGYINLNSKKPRAEFVTTSKTLAQQLKILLLRQKIQHSIYFEKSKEIRGVNHKDCYRIHIGEYTALKNMAKLMQIDFSYPEVSRISKHSWFDDAYFYAPIKHINKRFFEGRLFNLEVDKAHSYVSNAFTLHNCGDMMKVWIKVDKKNDRIKKLKWSTFGCASAIASTSMLSVIVTEKGGMKIEDALKIKPQDIVKRLGDLPQRKFHCSVLGDKALRAAINDYFRRTNQNSRIIVEGARVIDKDTGITDKDIEEAILEGADTLEKVQHKLKVGVSNKSCIPEVEQLIKFYKEKYFG
jgi:NifU-like protein involved in Fe-S cluster formation/bacterioferritin-associated ferredoxin